MGVEELLHTDLETERFANDLLNVILPLGVSLSVEKDPDRLIEKILLEAKSLCQADAGTLYIRTKDDRLKFSIMMTDSLGLALGGTTGRDIPYAPLRLYDPVTHAPNHHNIATHVALTGQSVNVPDIYRTEAFDFSSTRVFDRQNHYRSVSTLTIPLKNSEERVIAVLQLLNAIDPVTRTISAFNAYQQLVAESLSSQAAVALNNQLLRQREQELLKYERDLQIGRAIQAGFLPEHLPEPPGWEIAARFLPAREVAGDFYDGFSLTSGRIAVVIADVCDKGVGAALFMALVRSLMRANVQQRDLLDPSAPAITALKDAVVLTNAYVLQNHASMNMFATLFAGVLDPEDASLAYVNCGHNSPIVCGDNRIKGRLLPTGPAIGLMRDAAFGVRETHLMRGDLLLAFTDGVTDARDGAGRFFGESRLLENVRELSHARPADEVLGRLQEGLLAHIATAAQYDDITMLAVRRTKD